MKHVLFVVLLSICFSCNPERNNQFIGTGQNNDSIEKYYNRSFDESYSFEERVASIDRALDMVQDIGTDSKWNKVWYQKGSLLLQAGKDDSLIAHHKRILENGTLTGDQRMLASQHYLMGYYYDQIKADYSEAFKHYNTAKNYFESVDDSTWTGKCLLFMGVIQKNQNDFFGSKETVTEALQFFKEPKDKNDMVQCYNLLATDHRKLLNFEDAIAYYTLAIKDTPSLNDRSAYQNNLAATYLDAKSYENAVPILDTLISNDSLDHNSVLYARILDNRSFAKWFMGVEDQEIFLKEALQIRIAKNDIRGQIASYTHLGEYFMEKDPQMARAYLDTVIKLAQKIKVPRAETDALKFLMQLNPENVKLRDRYIFLTDSLGAKEIMVKTQFAKYKYDDRLKQESILRLEKEKAEQALLAAEERNKKTMSYLGSIVLLLGLSFAIYFFGQRTKRLKERNKLAKLEATLETEADMSRRLHDDFGAGLNQTMLMVQGDMDRSKILDRLDGLYNQSRNFSREVNEVSTGGRFKAEFLEMLRFRTPSEANLFVTGVKDIDWGEMTPLSQKVLFKIMQELMINMGKHSKANMVTIVFKHTGKTMMVKYSDNGVGASKEALNAKNGLRNTEKRIQAIAGTVIFDSGKGEGFTAHITIPF